MTETSPIHVLIVDDHPMVRKGLASFLLIMDDLELVGEAKDGLDALRRCEHSPPDVILMDLIMPVTDGVEATRQIMQQCPCPILVVTATVTGHCAKVYEALGHGALDAVNTPVLGRDGVVSGGGQVRTGFDPPGGISPQRLGAV